ncbi:MAG: hypothetical protein GY751_21840 [Bacteroidetes bacterium]|nr:hypothetical protein [Bacteroidota bacterium]
MRLLVIIWLVFPLFLQGNDLKISSLSLPSEEKVSFDLSWDNSWNYTDSIAPGNHDAVWLFVKGRSRATGAWEHLSIDPSGHTSVQFLTLNVSVDGSGVMVQRRWNGEGDVEVSTIILELEPLDISQDYDAVHVFGIEMVYIPEGGFYVGDSASNNSLVIYGSSDPYQITSESMISAGQTIGSLWTNADFPPAGNIPGDFPKGYTAFYSMKYEISQLQYAEFLNTLTPTQQSANQLSTLVEAPCFGSDHLEGERNFIVESDDIFGCDANANGFLNESDDGMEIACNFMTWAQITAYLDWSGLRPMTELEYEKICRGSEIPVPLEYAWGSPNIINTTYLSDEHTANEHSLDTIPLGYGSGNYGYCSPSGPLRCGFAANASTGRLNSGASYYGAMEMSGNLWELSVVLSEGGLNYTGQHGDGMLDASGAENAWNWDSGSGGHRGGAWNSGILPGFRDLAVSDRFFIYLDPDQLARGTSGGRGVITKNRFE